MPNRPNLRRGKMSLVSALISAGAVGTAGLVGTVMMQPEVKEARSPQGVEIVMEEPRSEESLLDAQLRIRRPSKKRSDSSGTSRVEPGATSNAVVASLTDQEPAGGSGPPISSDASLPSALPSSPASPTDALEQENFQSGTGTLTVGNIEPTQNYDEVEVYYATDRDRIDLSSVWLWAKIAFPFFLGICICCGMFIALLKSNEKWLWGLGLSLGLVMTVLFSHHAIVYGNQARRLAANGSVAFGSIRYVNNEGYPLHLGLAHVTLPKIHRIGSVERPVLWKGEFSESPEKHVMLQRLEAKEEEEFFERLRMECSQGEVHSAFVFIHGYNVQFNEALLRTAQIKKDLKFGGAAILYSWPSHGLLSAYRFDGDNSEWSAAHLEMFLRDVKERSQVKELHVIAHSMGNRALVSALERLTLNLPEKQPMLGQVVMAAPDVDSSDFKGRYAQAVDRCSRQATLYTSSNDRALILSKALHGYPRLGLTTGTPQRFDGIDTVEISPIDPSLLGHSYYGSHPLLIQDLQALIELGSPPGNRSWLVPFQKERSPNLWRFSPRMAAEATLRATSLR